MSRFHVVFLLVSLLILVASGKKEDNNSVATFRVYVHEYPSGPNATVFEVARANITADPATSSDLVLVADDLITSGPAIDSKKLGRGHGIAVNLGLDESAVTLNSVFVFTAGVYNGSTITIDGWKQLYNVNQELPIVGGTGAFRQARGYVVSNTYSYDPLTNHLVLIYDIYV